MEREEAIRKLADIKRKIISLDNEIDKMIAEIDSEEENEKDKKAIRKIIREFCIDYGNGIDNYVEIGKEGQAELYRYIKVKFRYIKGEKMSVYKALKYSKVNFEYLNETDKDGWKILKIIMPEME